MIRKIWTVCVFETSDSPMSDDIAGGLLVILIFCLRYVAPSAILLIFLSAL